MRNVRAAAGLLALPLLLLSGAAASADEGPSRTVERATELPPPRASDKELILLVGGLGSHPHDGAWDELIERYESDPRYEIRRFGTDPLLPYDTDGDLDANAQRLTAQVRTLAQRYQAIHLVAHSMGGAVADRSFATGLSSADGVQTYVALASPHNGSTAARIATSTLALAGAEAADLRDLARAVAHDPGSEATQDLAQRYPSSTPADVTRLDLRLATDLVVRGPDADVAGVDSRVLLPSAPESLEGHGGILRDDAALELVTSTIQAGAPPPDRRGAVLREATALVSKTADDVALLGLLATAAAALTLAAILRRRRSLTFAERVRASVTGSP